MRKVRNLMMVIACMALMGAMQAMAVTYAPAKPQKKAYGHPVHMVATAPATTFQSTSSLQSSGSVYTTTPALNANGTVDEEAYGVGSGPRRVGGAGSVGGEDDEGTGTGLNQEAHDDNKENGTPIGDAALPLMLMAGAFALFVYFRRKQTLKG